MYMECIYIGHVHNVLVISMKTSSALISMAYVTPGGAIPDAATIHAIRKKRQLARENQDYIPLNEDEQFENEKSRLVREEDHDNSDDDMEEEGVRIAMGVNKKDAQLRHMQQTILQAREGSVDRIYAYWYILWDNVSS